MKSGGIRRSSDSQLGIIFGFGECFCRWCSSSSSFFSPNNNFRESSSSRNRTTIIETTTRSATTTPVIIIAANRRWYSPYEWLWKHSRRRKRTRKRRLRGWCLGLDYIVRWETQSDAILNPKQQRVVKTPLSLRSSWGARLPVFLRTPPVNYWKRTRPKFFVLACAFLAIIFRGGQEDF